MSEAKRMRCSRRRRRYFKDVLLILSNTDAPHPTPHHLLRRSFSSRRSLFINFAPYLFNANVTSASFVQREVARDSVTEGLFLLKFSVTLPLCVTMAGKAFIANVTSAGGGVRQRDGGLFFIFISIFLQLPLIESLPLC